MTTQELMTKQGERIAKDLKLRKARQDDGTPFDPPRYHLESGSKTAVGLVLTIQKMAEDLRVELAEFERAQRTDPKLNPIQDYP